MKIIDLSVPLEKSPSEQPINVDITYNSHEAGAEFLCQFLGCTKNDLPGGIGCASELISLTSHSGTHVDAPWHYYPVAEDKKARTIDQLPLEWFFSNGVILDMRHKPKGAPITIDDLSTALNKIQYEIQPFDIILLQTGADKYWGKPEYLDAGCGLVKDSTLWLLNQGVKVIGIDAWGLDQPFWAIKEEFQRSHNKNIIWQAHYAGINIEYCQIEKLANLDKLPYPVGFKIACFPIKIKNAGAGWCRAVAILD